MKKNNKKDIPILIGFLNKLSQLRVWCPYCRKWHIHGGGDEDKGIITHRCAHCPSEVNSPFKSSGYYIKVLKRREDYGLETLKG